MSEWVNEYWVQRVDIISNLKSAGIASVLIDQFCLGIYLKIWAQSIIVRVRPLYGANDPTIDPEAFGQVILICGITHLQQGNPYDSIPLIEEAAQIFSEHGNERLWVRTVTWKLIQQGFVVDITEDSCGKYRLLFRL